MATKKKTPKKQKTLSATKKSNPPKQSTRVTVLYDCGFNNNLYIRGEGISTLSWDKGMKMKNIAADKWVFESTRPFSTLEFKVLINDTDYEQGENHMIGYAQTIEITPKF